jgi:uncharacterized coiled-coil protein SlyX
MRHLFIVFFLLSGTVFAQNDPAQEMATLRQLLESQSRLIAEQSSQLKLLTDRVAELESQSTVSAINATDPVAIENEPIPSRELAMEVEREREEPLDSEEIGQQQMQSFSTGKEAVIVEDAVALSDTVDIYGSMRL